MIGKRSWLALLAIPLGVAIALGAGAETKHPTSVGHGIDPTCTLSTPCIQYTNNGSAAGLEGLSLGGNGLFGVTKINSTTASNGRAGVFGNDQSTSGAFDSGVTGTSVRGAGVLGNSTSGAGILGTSSTGAGVSGTSTGANGIFGVTRFNSTSSSNGKAGVFGNDLSTSGSFDSGVSGKSVNGTGVSGQSSNHTGVSGTAGGSGTGVAGAASSGFGVVGTSSLGTGVFGSGDSVRGVWGSSNSGTGVFGFGAVGVDATGGSTNGGDPLPALSIVGNGTSLDLINACTTQDPCDSNSALFVLDTSGDVISVGNLSMSGDVDGANFATSGGVLVGGVNPPLAGSINISGQYQKDNSCVLGCVAATATATGRAVSTYSSMVSQPTVEDFGEAQLVNGQANVRLSADFANVVDRQSNYLVVVTPEGPSRGLYVTQKTPAGFAVMENPGGHSTLAFSYRIVAKPFGSHEARLPMVTLPKLRHSRRSRYVRPLHV